MVSNNQVRLIGNLTKDPDIFKTSSGEAGKIRIACNTRLKEKEDTLFINVKFFGNAYRDLEYNELVKGDKVCVEGRLSVEQWTTDEGQQKSEAVIYASSLHKIARKVVANHDF